MNPERRLQACLEDGVSRGIPGLSAAIAIGDDVVWTGVAGLADIRRGQPIDRNMAFGIGSITKPFVATIVLQLVAERRLQLDDTVAFVLGSAADRIANAAEATVAQLMSHCSGIPSWEWEPSWIREGRGADLAVDRVWGKLDTLPYIRDLPAIAPVGLAADYSNTNYTLLGLIVERVTGNDLVDELHARILQPLCLADIQLEGFEAARSNQGPHRYHWATDTFVKDAGVHSAFPKVRPNLVDVSASNLSVEWAAGGLVATAGDLARFGAALRSGALLSADRMASMQQWTTVIEAREFGLGVYRERSTDGTALIGHDGGVLGFSATLFWIEGTDVVVTMLSNAGKMHSGAVPVTIQDVARQRPFLEAARAVG